MHSKRAIIFHVEDDPGWQYIIHEYVQLDDHVVALQVSTVAQALAAIPTKLQTLAVNVAILDGKLLDGSGEQVVQALKKSRLPIVIIAVSDRPIDGADVNIRKRWPNELDKAISMSLQTRK